MKNLVITLISFFSLLTFQLNAQPFFYDVDVSNQDKFYDISEIGELIVYPGDFGVFIEPADLNRSVSAMGEYNVITLPFEMEYFGEKYGKISVTQYGNVYLAPATYDVDGSNDDLEEPGNEYCISPYWSHFGSNNVYYRVEGSPGERKLFLQWVPEFTILGLGIISIDASATTSSHEIINIPSFQMIYEENSGRICFAYGTVEFEFIYIDIFKKINRSVNASIEFDPYATVGIKGAQNEVHQYYFKKLEVSPISPELNRSAENSISPGMSIIYTPNNCPRLFQSVVVEQISCPGANDGLIHLYRGEHDYLEVLWHDNGSTETKRNGLAPGIYTATVTGQCGSEDMSFEIKAPTDIEWKVDIHHGNVCQSGDATAQLLLAEPHLYNVVWEDGTKGLWLRNFSSGPHKVTLYSKNNCFDPMSHTFDLQEEQPLGIDVTHDPIHCPDQIITNIMATTSGGGSNHQIIWSDHTTGETHSDWPNDEDLIAYVRDERGCIASKKVNQFISPFGLQLRRGNDWIQTQINGGTAPFIFEWSDGVNGSFRTGMAPGYYELTVTDANGCTRTWGLTMGSPNRGQDIKGWIEHIDVELTDQISIQSPMKVTPSLISSFAEVNVGAEKLHFIEIFNTAGQLMKNYSNLDGRNNVLIETEDLTSGLYIIKAKTDIQTHSRKIQVK